MDHLFLAEDLKACAEEFLLYGIDSESALSNKEASERLLLKWEDILKEKVMFDEHLSMALTDAYRCLAELQKHDIASLFKIYVMKQTEIQLITVAKALEKLQQYSSVLQIPNLVLEVLRSIPKPIPTESKLLQTLSNTILRLKAVLLNSFHEKFEKHMSESEDSMDPQKAWASFLSDARDWLLAYTMVSLLPYTLSDTNLLVEKYKETLDSVFTPLWGKFHFYLTNSRDTHSTQQLIWSFTYAKNFFYLLRGLCVELTSSSKLQQLHATNYKTAGIIYISNKITRFMRAHLAYIIVSFSPLNTYFCSELIEQSLELDHIILEASAPELFLSEVLTDSKTILVQWLAADQTYFMNSIVEACSKAESVFQCRFTSSIFNHTENIDNFIEENDSHLSSYSSSFTAIQTAHLPTTRCYHALYDCLNLVILSCQRYATLPAQAQNVFCEIIIEPLLCICLGILLYRVRSCDVLCNISAGQLPYWSLKSRPDEMKMVIDSSLYLQTVLEASVTMILCTKEGRFQSRWNRFRSWISEAARAGVSLRAVPEYIMATCKCNDSNASSCAIAETGNIKTAVLLVRNQSDAICSGLEQQFHEALAKTMK